MLRQRDACVTSTRHVRRSERQRLRDARYIEKRGFGRSTRPRTVMTLRESRWRSRTLRRSRRPACVASLLHASPACPRRGRVNERVAS